MSKIVQYFHIRPYDRGHGGATIKVTGDAEDLGQVDVQVAFCSKKDMFCKKTGRSLAEQAVTKVVPLRYLPSELARVNTAVEKKTKRFTAATLKGTDFSFTMKYFLPKE